MSYQFLKIKEQTKIQNLIINKVKKLNKLKYKKIKKLKKQLNLKN